MLLGSPDFFHKKHYENNKGLSKAWLSELVVHCLELVAQLSYSELNYRFKGGNSLLIILENPQRFSIDVDIVSTESKEKIIDTVEEIVDRCDVFTRFESRQPKTKPWLPMISFKLFFDSLYQKTEDSFVMLDVVLEAAPYEGMKKPVKCLDIYKADIEVEVPTVSGLIGDKLLTIGPSTLGIPLGKGKEAHRLKHVFDIALLSRQGYDAVKVKMSVLGCLKQENAIQKSNFNWKETAEDTQLFCNQPLLYPEVPRLESIDPDSYLFEIVKGFEEFREHLFGRDYQWTDFQDDCKRILKLLEETA